MPVTKVQEIIKGMQDAKSPSEYWRSCNIDFPELKATHQVMQRNGESVWTHTMRVIDLLADAGPVALLSGLFHDLGKWCVQPMDDPSLPRFPEHDRESALIAKVRLEEWGASPDMTDGILRIVSTHMYDIRPTPTKKAIRAFVARVGRNNLRDWFLLRIADSSSYDLPQKYRNRLIVPFQKAILSFVAKQPNDDQLPMHDMGTPGRMSIEGGDD